MVADSKGRGLFIVDNSVSGWTGLCYLEEWSGIAKAFDIATGYFEIAALLALDGRWQALDKIRILMGAEMTHRTRKTLLDAVRARAVQILDGSLEANKDTNPFLHRVPAILEALRSGQIECRVYDKDKFHAKAYITHAKIDVIGSQALVGSSNFTSPGLTKNIELNIQVQSAREVAQLQEWFEAHWNEAAEVTDAIAETISRHTHRYTPFDVYAKALQEYFRGHELTATEWDETRSKMFPRIDRYQKEAYRALMKIARQHGGAFLCDGVGLGKTFVGLMLIERLVLHEGKRVVLFAPKATKEGVWEPHLSEWLPHIGGVGGNADFSNLAVFSHTDLGRKGDFPERFRRIAELADIVVIDEAHHFRNPRTRGSDDEDEDKRSYQLNAASVRLTDEIQKVWAPDPKRAEAARLRVSANAQYLKVVVEDDLGVEIELNQRSEGFQWLVSFFVVFFAEASDKHENAILLLDEPGLSLHGLKQREFRTTVSRLAKSNQTLYTTHSPFLVGPGELDLVRVVEMTDRKVGTKVLTQVTANDPAALLPLQEALGYDLAQSLFAQRRNLVLEGLTDYWYVESLAEILRAAKLADLDQRIALLPQNRPVKLSTTRQFFTLIS